MAAKKDRRFEKLKKWALTGWDEARVLERVAGQKVQAQQQLQAREWRLALPAFDLQVSLERILAVRKILNGDASGWFGVERMSYTHALAAVGNPFAAAINRTAGPLAHLMLVGDDRLFRSLAQVAVATATSKGGPWKDATCMNFLIVLHARLRKYEAMPAFSVGGYAALLDNLENPDSDALTPAVLDACEHHLDHSGLDPKSLMQEFESGYELIPLELAAFRAARSELGLSFPNVTHPLLSTPLADIPPRSSYAYKEDAELQPSLDLTRELAPGFQY